MTRKGKLKLKREESEESPEDDQITHSGLSIVGGSILIFAWLAILIGTYVATKKVPETKENLWLFVFQVCSVRHPEFPERF